MVQPVISEARRNRISGVLPMVSRKPSRTSIFRAVFPFDKTIGCRPCQSSHRPVDSPEPAVTRDGRILEELAVADIHARRARPPDTAELIAGERRISSHA
jgi:hypothetical protein